MGYTNQCLDTYLTSVTQNKGADFGKLIKEPNMGAPSTGKTCGLANGACATLGVFLLDNVNPLTYQCFQVTGAVAGTLPTTCGTTKWNMVPVAMLLTVLFRSLPGSPKLPTPCTSTHRTRGLVPWCRLLRPQGKLCALPGTARSGPSPARPPVPLSGRPRSNRRVLSSWLPLRGAQFTARALNKCKCGSLCPPHPPTAVLKRARSSALSRFIHAF